MEQQKNFEWVEFYKEFANELLDYKDNRKLLLDKLKNVFDLMSKLGLATNRFSDDIDPFTVFAIFNKGGEDKRKQIIAQIIEDFDMKASVPATFDGVPVPYDGNTIYYSDKNDIDNIWDLFYYAMEYTKNPTEDNREKVEKYFDLAINIKGNACSKITMALYWLNPDFYVSLDSRSLWYLCDSGNISEDFLDTLSLYEDAKEAKEHRRKQKLFYEIINEKKISGSQYFEVLFKLKSYLKNTKTQNFIEFSALAYDCSEADNMKQKKNGMTDKEANNLDRDNGKNIIIYGVPGSGKSYYIKKQLEEIAPENVERVIFYPEYTYYDFVGQKVPNGDGGLSFEPGNFTKILYKALKNKNQQYYLIIEELNRGNAEAIFGDIFQLLDRNSDGNSEYHIDNVNLMEYFRKEEVLENEEEIYIPSNLTIYATINNADQKVFNFDTAFGRRWEYRMMPCDVDPMTVDESSMIFLNGYIKGTDTKWNDIRESINKKIIANRENIYNAEEKRLGLYYIDESLLSKKKVQDDKDYKDELEEFASKIFRYLYLNVFKNNLSDLFKDNLILENYIQKFVEEKDINNILDID